MAALTSYLLEHSEKANNKKNVKLNSYCYLPDYREKE